MSSTVGKTINCRAAVLWSEGKPLTIENITVDPPKRGEVRVRMVSAGLCATDAHFIWGWVTDIYLDFEGNPVVLGHEGAGIIESVGPDVSNVEIGDKIISGTSTFSEYSVIRSTQLAKINPSADLKKLCIISCVVGTGYGSATNIAKVHSGSKCAVWGLGAIGLSTVLGCKQAGAKTVIGVARNPDKEGIARKFGCTDFVNSKAIDEPIESLFQRDGGLDYAADCIGDQQVLDSAYKSLSPRGALTVFGLGPRDNKVEAKVSELLMGRQVMGGYFGNLKPRAGILALVDKYSTGSLPIDDLITQRIRLDDINQGFDYLKAGNTIRTVIDF